jgi:hypothetical protein
MHGGRFRELWNWVVDNKTIAFVIAVIALALGAWAIFKG